MVIHWHDTAFGPTGRSVYKASGHHYHRTAVGKSYVSIPYGRRHTHLLPRSIFFEGDTIRVPRTSTGFRWTKSGKFEWWRKPGRVSHAVILDKLGHRVTACGRVVEDYEFAEWVHDPTKLGRCQCCSEWM